MKISIDVCIGETHGDALKLIDDIENCRPVIIFGDHYMPLKCERDYGFGGDGRDSFIGPELFNFKAELFYISEEKFNDYRT